jgi:hypothetical protein
LRQTLRSKVALTLPLMRRSLTLRAVFTSTASNVNINIYGTCTRKRHTKACAIAFYLGAPGHYHTLTNKHKNSIDGDAVTYTSETRPGLDVTMFEAEGGARLAVTGVTLMTGLVDVGMLPRI